MGADSRNIDFASKVPREITEVGALLDDGTSTENVIRGMGMRKRQFCLYLLDLSHHSGLAIAS